MQRLTTLLHLPSRFVLFARLQWWPWRDMNTQPSDLIIINFQCCGSGMFIPDPGSNFFSIPYPGSKFFTSRILIKEFKYFNAKKCFLSSRKYVPGYSSRIRIVTFYPSRIPDPGVKKAPDPGSWSATLLILCRRVPLLVRGGQAGAGVRLAAGRHQGALHQITLYLRHPSLSPRK
jgi:hypothetical protein